MIFKFLKPEEKIRSLRKKYKITQRELSEGEMTRPFLAMIETGTRTLTERTAKLLCTKINKILENMGESERVSVSEIMESVEEQAIKYLKKAIESEEYDISIIDEALYLINNDKRVEICFELGEKFKKIELLDVASKYYSTTISGSNDFETIKKSLLEVTRIDFRLNKFEKTLELIPKFKDEFIKKLDYISERILYNFALASDRAKKNEQGKEILLFLIKNTKDDDVLINSKKLLAYIYQDGYNNLQKASELFKEVYFEAKNTQKMEQAIFCLFGLLDLEIEQGIKENLEQGIIEIEKIYNSNNISFDEWQQVVFYKNLGKKYFLLNKKAEAKKNLLISYELNEKLKHYNIKNEEEIFEILFELFAINDLETVKKIESNLLKKENINYKSVIRVLSFYEKYEMKTERCALYKKTVDKIK